MRSLAWLAPIAGVAYLVALYAWGPGKAPYSATLLTSIPILLGVRVPAETLSERAYRWLLMTTCLLGAAALWLGQVAGYVLPSYVGSIALAVTLPAGMARLAPLMRRIGVPWVGDIAQHAAWISAIASLLLLAELRFSSYRQSFLGLPVAAAALLAYVLCSITWVSSLVGVWWAARTARDQWFVQKRDDEMVFALAVHFCNDWCWTELPNEAVRAFSSSAAAASSLRDRGFSELNERDRQRVLGAP